MSTSLLPRMTVLHDDELDAINGGGCVADPCKAVVAVSELAVARIAFVIGLLP